MSGDLRGFVVTEVSLNLQYIRQTREAALLVRAAMFTRAFVVLLAIDTALITLHLFVLRAQEGTSLAEGNFRLDRDGSLSEWFEYAKLAAAALMLAAASLRHGARELLPIAAILVLVLLDNSLTWHEQMGLG